MTSRLPVRPIRAVAFDLDGLIFNTEHVFAIAAAQLFENRNLVMPEDLIRRMMGRRPPEGMWILKEALGTDDSVENVQEECSERFLGLLDLHLEPMPGVFELFTQLEELGLPKAVATSSPLRFLDNLMGRFDGLFERFQFALTAENVEQGKPNPEIYLKAAAKLNVNPDEMLVFEDSEAGTNAAAAAGAFVVSVPHEHSRYHDFSNACRIADTLRDPLIADVLRVASPA
ncbi:MAG: HAD family phosphatase [Planctomycetota bacterium]|nr:HAD family phosphatase [Planctomycetota bacterium]MDA1162158.1 HAD family phosphatase [Planctomycetota bacterium]